MVQGTRECDACHGKGFRYEGKPPDVRQEPCRACKGKGWKPASEEIPRTSKARRGERRKRRR